MLLTLEHGSLQIGLGYRCFQMAACYINPIPLRLSTFGSCRGLVTEVLILFVFFFFVTIHCGSIAVGEFHLVTTVPVS